MSRDQTPQANPTHGAGPNPDSVPTVGPANSVTRGGDVDALLLVSFGGPEGPDEVVPFLQRVTAGRGIPPERLTLVGKHYFDRGGISPINEQCRTLIVAIEEAFEAHGVDLPVYWGNRNSPPFLEDTVQQMADDGIEHAVAFVTSAYSSYSGCRQYRENMAAAQQAVTARATDNKPPVIEKLRVFFNHPGFIDPLVDGLRATIADRDPSSTHVFFTAHSIPTASAMTCNYEQQITNAASMVVERSGSTAPWSVVWQSRSGPPTVPWLEPDICDAIAALDQSVYRDVVVVPIGFISDHMEVLQDLDTDAAAAATAAGLGFARLPTSSTDPRFTEMIVQLVQEQIHNATPLSLGKLALVPDQCGETCCPPPTRRPKPES